MGEWFTLAINSLQMHVTPTCRNHSGYRSDTQVVTSLVQLRQGNCMMDWLHLFEVHLCTDPAAGEYYPFQRLYER